MNFILAAWLFVEVHSDSINSSLNYLCIVSYDFVMRLSLNIGLVAFIRSFWYFVYPLLLDNYASIIQVQSSCSHKEWLISYWMPAVTIGMDMMFDLLEKKNGSIVFFLFMNVFTCWWYCRWLTEVELCCLEVMYNYKALMIALKLESYVFLWLLCVAFIYLLLMYEFQRESSDWFMVTQWNQMCDDRSIYSALGLACHLFQPESWMSITRPVIPRLKIMRVIKTADWTLMFFFFVLVAVASKPG